MATRRGSNPPTQGLGGGNPDRLAPQQQQRRRMSVYRPSIQLGPRGVRTATESKSEHSEGSGPKVPVHMRYENTYKMQPEESERFISYKVEYLVKDILEAYLRRTTYEPDHCSKLAQDLCAIIKSKVKEMGFHRYKLVSQVIIGQDSDQSVQIASRCLWNHETDNFAAATYRNDSIYAIAIVYGVHLD